MNYWEVFRPLAFMMAWSVWCGILSHVFRQSTQADLAATFLGLALYLVADNMPH